MLSGRGEEECQGLCKEKYECLSGHTSRILKVVKSSEGSAVASAGADETIRIWSVWPRKEKKAKKTLTVKDKGSSGMMSLGQLR